MRILLEVREKNQAQLEDDLRRLRSEVILPMQITSWEVKTHSDSSWKRAEAFWMNETNEGRIRFSNRYFEEKNWKQRITTFLHELSHIYLFFSEGKCLDWRDISVRLIGERTKRETKEERYNIKMANWIVGFLYPQVLALPIEFLAEECFKQKFPNFFSFRTSAFYDMRTKTESVLEKWQEENRWKGSELVAPYNVYWELLKIRHFLKIIDNDDLENLSRFGKVCQKRKHLLNTLCNEELLRYFTENEDKLTTVSLSPLYFPEEDFLELSDKLWNFPRTS